VGRWKKSTETFTLFSNIKFGKLQNVFKEHRVVAINICGCNYLCRKVERKSKFCLYKFIINSIEISVNTTLIM